MDGDTEFGAVEERLAAEALIVDVDGFEGPLGRGVRHDCHRTRLAAGAALYYRRPARGYPSLVTG